MKSARHDTFGDPAEVLKSADTGKPQPGAGELLVRMILSPVHNHDLWTIRGSYGYKPDLPATGGSEAVGVVEAAGEGADQDLVGKRVAAAGVRGSWAEYFTVPAAAAVPLPAAVPDEIGAQLIAMPFSAISLLEFLDVKEGDWVIQTAANGAVGKVFAALAKQRGVRTLNLVRRADAVADLEALGIDNVLDTSQDGWKDRAREILGEAGARAAVDSVGGGTANDLAALLGMEGLLVTFGTATGAPMALETGPLIFKHLTVKGFWGAKVAQDMAPETRGRLIGELGALAAAGGLALPAEAVFGLDDAGEAMAAAAAPGRKGKVLFRG